MWETVLDQTHTYTAPQDCADSGKGEGEDAKPPGVEGEGGKGGPDEDLQKDAAGDTLPVTGGAPAGLVVAALAAAGAGGGALYLARKRKAAAGTDSE